MNSKFISLYKNKPVNSFVARYASILEKKQEVNSYNPKNEFDLGYKQGKLKYITACKYMKLTDCGLNRFVEASSNSFWKKEGDEIIRVENNLSWVDDFLKEQEAKNEIH